MECRKEHISFEPFYRDEMVMIAPYNEQFLDIKGDQKKLLALIRKEPVIMREQVSGSKKCMESYFESMNIKEKELNVVARLNEQESIKKLVAGGLGISFISKKAVEDDSRAGRLLVFSLPGHPALRSLYLAYRKDYVLREHIAQFMGFLKSYYLG